MTLQHAGGATPHVERTVAWRATEPHHGAARATDGRCVVGENDFCAFLARNIDETLGDGSRAPVEMYDPWPEAAEHGAKRERRILIRRPVRARERWRRCAG